MKAILKKILLLPLTLCFLLFSCEKNVEETEEKVPVTTSVETSNGTQNPPTTPGGSENPPTTTVISFATNVKPIIDNNCVECHGGSRFPDLRSHTIIAANSGLIKNVVVTRRMPLGGSLSNEQIATISDWIDSGALDN